MADRRDELVVALARVVARDGWEGATVAATAREAGLAPGLVHYYFPRKLDLLLALVARLQAGLEARIRARVARRRSTEQRVAALIDACLATGDDADPVAVRCFVAIGAQAARDPEVAVGWKACLDRLRQALVEAGLPAPAAAGVLAAVLGCWELGVVHPDLLPAGTAAATVRAMARSVTA